MRRQTQIGSGAFALAVCALLIVGCHTSSLQPPETVADSISGFSGKQGANGWSYGYWDRTADVDQRYNQTTDFQLLRHFGNDPINKISRRSDFTTGTLWMLQDGVFYTALWAEGGSANGTAKSPPQAKVEHWAVRRWVSTVNGSITISGHAAKILDWGDVDGGQARVVVDGATIFSAATHGRDTNYSINTEVHVGSLVDFLITAGPTASGGAFGPVKFTATIRAAQKFVAGSSRQKSTSFREVPGRSMAKMINDGISILLFATRISSLRQGCELRKKNADFQIAIKMNFSSR